MACIVKSQRLQDVFDVVRGLMIDPDSGVNTYEDIVAYFAENFPEISEVEIGQAIAPVSEVNRRRITEQLEETKSRLQRLTKAVGRLNGILKSDREYKGKVPPMAEEAEINDLISTISSLAGYDVQVPPEAWGDIVGRLERLQVLRDAYFEMNGEEVSEDHIERAVENLREIRKLARIDDIDAKIKEIDDQIEKFNSGELSFEDIEGIDGPVSIKGFDEEVAAKELELQEKRAEFEMKMRYARARHKAETRGILGIKSPTAVSIAEHAIMFRQSFWEPFRALKFMGDISAWGVQAAPIVYSMMTDFNWKAALRGEFGEAFASQRALGQVFMQTTAHILIDGARKSSRWGKRSGSTIAQELLREIKESPAYLIAKKAKLQISESRSLTSSEEVFTSNMINKVPLMGAVKDISEDTMVSTLNALRMHKFYLFWKATDGNATMEEYERVAELINKMTGTTNNSTANKIAYGTSMFLSAPKLFISRLSLALVQPFKAFSGIDIPKSKAQRGLAFQSEADRFVFFETMKAFRGYAFMTTMLSIIGGMFGYFDYEEDPAENDFMRFRFGDTAVDATGGVGTIYRTISKYLQLTYGPASWSSYTNKDKYNYIKNVQKQSGIGALLKGFVQYKLHPTVTGLNSIISGRDFFGDSFNYITQDGVGPHLEGAARALLPISFETAVDDAVDLVRGDAKFGEVLVSSSMQFMGMNTFRYDTRMGDIKVQDFLNKLEYRPKPRYPERLAKAKDSREAEYLRSKFRKEYEDRLGDLLISQGLDAERMNKELLKNINKQVYKEVGAQFTNKYRDDLLKLELDPEKVKK